MTRKRNQTTGGPKRPRKATVEETRDYVIKVAAAKARKQGFAYPVLIENGTICRMIDAAGRIRQPLPSEHAALRKLGISREVLLRSRGKEKKDE